MTEGNDSEVVGTDGTKQGWVAVKARDGQFARVAEYPDLSSLVEAHSAAEVIAIDIPLSSPAGAQYRAADSAGKAMLGKASPSLFLVPPREVFETPDYAAANELCKRVTGRGLSCQSFALRIKMLEAVRFLEATRDSRIWEVHPEISFRVLAELHGNFISSSKKTWNGMVERWRLLAAARFTPPLNPSSAILRAGVDDVLDAAVAAWTATRISTGEAISIPDEDTGVVVRAASGNPAVIRA